MTDREKKKIFFEKKENFPDKRNIFNQFEEKNVKNALIRKEKVEI